MKRFTLSLALASAFALPAVAADYYVVVPIKGRVAAPETPPDPAAAISVSLQSASLPDGLVGQAYSYDLKQHLLVTGDPSLDLAQSSWSASTALPAGLSLSANGVISGQPTVAGPGQNFSVQATYKTKSATQTYAISVAQVHDSCKSLLTAQPGTPSGWYSLSVGGITGSYYCDMTSDGGGWTRVVLQYESNPVAWTGGSNGSSYAISQAGIPAHTQVGFGADNKATDVDYVTFQYTTGDIPKTLVTSPKTGLTYHVHRSATHMYGAHDPEGSVMNFSEWYDTLTFDKTGGAFNTWAYTRVHYSTTHRGYSYRGNVETSEQNFAWSVWVR